MFKWSTWLSPSGRFAVIPKTAKLFNNYHMLRSSPTGNMITLIAGVMTITRAVIMISMSLIKLVKLILLIIKIKQC